MEKPTVISSLILTTVVLTMVVLMTMHAIGPEQLDAPNNWTAVVAVASNGVIGRSDRLPWKLRSDLMRFKRMTMGHCLLMGRKTYESIGRPLPGRQTIVLSRSADVTFPGVTVVSNLLQVQKHVEPNRQVMVVGGAQIYAGALEFCDTLWFTRVLEEVDGDTCFPAIVWHNWELVSSEPVPAGPDDDWPSEFEVWRRRTLP